MPGSEIVASTEALEGFLPSLRQFRKFGVEHIQRAMADLRHAQRGVEQVRREAEREVSRLQSEITGAGEDEDTSHLEHELTEAERRCEEISQNIRDFEEIRERCEREAERLRRHLEERIPRSETYLTKKINDLHAIRAIQMDGARHTSESKIPPSSNLPPHSEPMTAGTLDFTSHPLPSGYCWARLSDMDLNDAFADVKSPEDFRPHATYDMLRGGLDTLRATVLPAIAKHGYTADSYFFEQLDKTNACNPESGARRAFESFFGDEAIALQRNPNGGPLTVINGRHRIKAAQDAGWMVVPAKITKKISP